jgi:hypothetical protein
MRSQGDNLQVAEGEEEKSIAKGRGECRMESARVGERETEIRKNVCHMIQDTRCMGGQ